MLNMKDNEYKASYIREIASILFDAEDEIEIFRSVHGCKPKEEDPYSWKMFDDNGPIEGGVYLLKLLGKFKVDKYLSSLQRQLNSIYTQFSSHKGGSSFRTVCLEGPWKAGYSEVQSRSSGSLALELHTSIH
jgi:hypothetical protein